MYVTSKEKWKISDKIAFWGIIVSAAVTLIAVYVAYRTLDVTQKSIAASDSSTKRALEISDSTANALIESNRISALNYNLAKDAFDSTNRANNTTIGLSEQTLKAQVKYAEIAENSFLVTSKYAIKSDSNYIKSIQLADSSLKLSKESLKSVQKNFETENKAIIFMSDFYTDTLKANRIIRTNIKLKNTGKSPTILGLVQRYYVVSSVYNLGKFPYPYLIETTNVPNMFMEVNKEINVPLNIGPFPQAVVDSVVNNQLFVYVYGQALYYDLIRRNGAEYQFCIRVMPNNVYQIPLFHNMIIEATIPKQ